MHIAWYCTNLQVQCLAGSITHTAKQKVKSKMYVSKFNVILQSLEIQFFQILRPNSNFSYNSYVQRHAIGNLHSVFHLSISHHNCSGYISVYPPSFRERIFVTSLIHKHLLSISFFHKKIMSGAKPVINFH